jgi:hypothetical protein
VAFGLSADSDLYATWGVALACALLAAATLGGLLLWVLVTTLRTERYTRRCLEAAEHMARDASATHELEAMDRLARDLLELSGRIEGLVDETGEALSRGPVPRS